MDAVNGLRLTAVEEMAELRPVVDLFAEVWGRNEDGVPIPAEMLRSLVHAGGLVSAAYDEAPASSLGAGALGRDGARRSATATSPRRGRGTPTAASGSRSSSTSARWALQQGWPGCRGPSTRW